MFPVHTVLSATILYGYFFLRYTYGKAVKGEAIISVYPTTVSEVIQPIYQNPLRKVIPIDGKAVVQFDVVKDLK